MHVRALVLQNFTTHNLTKVSFPLTGIVLVTGENGSGKSSLLEGVAWGVYGKTLRDEEPWREDAKEAPCKVVVSLADTHYDLVATRSRKGAKTSFEFESLDGESVEYETTTKAQEALVAQVGSYDLWRRSHVFSSSDAAHFSLATDKERKQLIETFLGNDRFDPALQACRADLKAMAVRVSEYTHKVALGESKLEAVRARIKQAKTMLASTPPDPPRPPAEEVSRKMVDDLVEQLARAKKELGDLRTAARRHDQKSAELTAAVKSAERELARLKDARCSTCNQPIPAALRATAEAEAKKARAAASTLLTEVPDTDSLAEELEEEIEALQAKRQKIIQASVNFKTALALYEQAAKQRALVEKERQAADQELGELTEQLEETHRRLEVCQSEHAELVECEKVLGLKGVRAHILGKSLSGIEAVANSYLARLHGGELQLRPYSETKSGGTSDSISLKVVGRGRGSYKSTSNGERRRVDVALLLGLGEVAAASRGAEAGTLWFDEVMDSLDENGVAEVTDLLVELAKERCVVIITHNRALKQALGSVAVKKLEVVAGTIHEV